MATHYKGEPLPFSLYFQDYNGESYPVEHLWKKGEKPIYKFTKLMENARVRLQFHTDRHDDYDKDAKVVIQTSRYDSQNKQEFHVQGMTIGKSDVEWIYEGEKGKLEYPWRMGIYLLQVVYKGERYIGGINVLPLHMKEEQVIKIHEYLDKKVEGIIYDFVYNQNSPSEMNEKWVPHHWYYDYATKMEKVYNGVIHHLFSLVKTPRYHITSDYEEGSIQKKTDSKSARWSLVNYSKNQTVLNKVKRTHYDTAANQWMKNIFLFWKKDIIRVRHYIEGDQRKLRLIEAEKSEQYERYKKKKHEQYFKKDISEKAKHNIISELEMTEDDLNEIRRQSALIERMSEKLRLAENKLVYFLNNTFFSSVKRGIKKPPLKNTHYYQLDKTYRELKKYMKDTGEDDQVHSILKPTWQIYEYFCLFKVLEIFTQEGYTITEGMDSDIVNLYFQDRIKEGEKFVLENDDRVIHVWYDHYHSHQPQEAFERGEWFYTYNSNKKPDIKIDRFDKTDQGLWFIGSTVLDAKFRKLDDIYNHEYMNKTTEQLMGYHVFFYAGENTDNRGACVDNVICLYAGSRRKKPDPYSPITFIQLTPTQGDHEAVKGEDELRNSLLEI
ncbi:hypothetical protein IMZ31_21845 (plasmid) [Pontibacillus sp. ALD_SL1]|uniref:hypothetical protein n=1 Tax=Pontibacillus sp. ALD_SL1 TaxID=2777185 RepID=UPI001A968523|nr:hypothetical protein [Pontibacillus sp. ALD_SL1]QST02096.1 hypothetical protein IMZ31_21845 [Pontibacillus sp. ALD_SL1]